MNDIQAEHSKIGSIFHSLQPYNDQIKECLLIGWSISKLHYQTKVFTGRDVDASEFGHYQSWILKKDYDNLKKGASNGTNKITYEMGTKIQQKGNKLYSSWAKSSDMKAVKKQFAKMLKSKKQKKRIQKDIIKSANLMTRGIKEDGYRPQ